MNLIACHSSPLPFGNVAYREQLRRGCGDGGCSGGSGYENDIGYI